MTPEIEIRDATVQRLSRLSRYGSPARIRKSFLLPTKDSEVPCALVYFAGSSMTAEGDANAGEPTFVHSLRLVVSSLIKANASEALDGELDEAASEILDTLLSDASWLRLFDGVPQIERSYQLAADEPKRLVMAEARTIFTIEFRTEWPPVVVDDFAAVTIRTDDGPDAVTAEFTLPHP